MSIQDQSGEIIFDQAGEPFLDQARSPLFTQMSKLQEILITTTPASGSRSAWTSSINGVATVSIRAADWGACTALDFVYSPISGRDDEEFEPPAGAEYPVFKSVASDDTEMVFQVEPSDRLYSLAVIPTGNDGSTDIQILIS